MNKFALWVLKKALGYGSFWNRKDLRQNVMNLLFEQAQSEFFEHNVQTTHHYLGEMLDSSAEREWDAEMSESRIWNREYPNKRF